MGEVTAQGRLRVYVGAPGKTLFTQMPGGRLRVYPGDYAGELEPDVVVIPCSQPSKFDADAVSLPEPVLKRLRDGAAGLVFDSSLEGQTHGAAWSEVLHGLADRLGAPLSRTVYVTQDRDYAGDYVAWCDAAGVRGRMSVLNYDYWIRRFFRRAAGDGERVFAERLEAFRLRRDQRPNRFLSLNWTPRPAKVLFLLRLMRDGLWDSGDISFGGFDLLQRHNNRSVLQFYKAMRRQAGFEDLTEELAPLLPALDGLGRIALGEAAADAADAPARDMTGDEALAAFQTSWFSVVTESEMLERACRITEKPFKPLVNFHPIVVLGNPGSLEMVRAHGFQTFGGLFDESYDQEPDPRRRFELVYAEVAVLCRMDEARLARLSAALDERLVFNAQWGLTKLPGIFRDRVDREFLDALTRAVRGA